MDAETRKTDMHLSEMKSARMVWRSFPPVASPPISASSSTKNVSRLPSCDKGSVTAALPP